MILAIRTDKPEAEVSLLVDNSEAASKKWLAHRELGATLHAAIKELLEKNSADWDDIHGIIFYKGPGSFTGLRIGASIVNALAWSNKAPVCSVSGADWLNTGMRELENGANTGAIPEYGSDPHITRPKK